MMSGIRLISGCHNRTPAPSARNIIKKFRKIAATGMASVVCPETKAQNKGRPSFLAVSSRYSIAAIMSFPDRQASPAEYKKSLSDMVCRF